MDKKVARIAWNSNGWRKPTGSNGKAGNKDAFEKLNGFGHEEWLLDDSRIIDGYHYSYIEPVNKGPYEGQTFEIHFFSRDSEAKEKYYLGYISSVYCLTPEEAGEAFAQYEKRGWIESMKDDIRAMGGDAESFGVLKDSHTPQNMFNIRFRMEDVHFFNEPAPIADDDLNTKAEYYRLYDYKGEFSLKKSSGVRDDRAALFEKYVCSCVSSQITKQLLEPASAKQIVKNLNPDFIFDVVPEMRDGIESFYDISDPEVITKLIDRLRSNGRFNNNDSRRFRQTALSHYATFLRVLKFLQEAQGYGVYTAKNEFRQFAMSFSHYQKYLNALRTKPFLLLAGISGTGKSRIVREMAFKSCPPELQDADGTTPGNYLMVEVKPNWHDSSELLGYYSSIGKEYKFTEFVKFLVKAMMHPEVPFFVCMDEMNLAPVEQYFAEFLSVLETRKMVGEHIESGSLVKADNFRNFGLMGCRNNGEVYMKLWQTTSEGIDEDAAASTSLIEKGLSLPDNVFIIGTVNMDDTTHQFSRKVIDRAMTIEMNGGELDKMFGRSTDLSYVDKPWTMVGELKNHYVQADDVLAKYPNKAEAIKEKTVAMLTAINEPLEKTAFEVSYRVLNELVVYLGVLLDDQPDADLDTLVATAADHILIQKILPRVEGDEDTFTLTEENHAKISDAKITNKLNWLESECERLHLTASLEKLKEMNGRLQGGFTRFWP